VLCRAVDIALLMSRRRAARASSLTPEWHRSCDGRMPSLEED